ncbi:hypothetical protein [Paludibacterium paludis]|nr:hypothetical protein [Paludibacterium paludis]
MRQAAEPFAPWEAYGHLLHDRRAARSRELARWRRAADECGVLSFARSAACAQRYVARYAGGRATRCELWNVKEGHTSSVWRVRLATDGAMEEFALNVARDRLAGEELARTSETMHRIAEAWPDANLARVRDIARVSLAKDAAPVVVTRNEWIADSFELHRLPAPGEDPGPLVAVERFLADDGAPSRPRRILGRRLTGDECGQVERDVGGFLAHTARLGARLDINDGDLVWNGQRAIVIAIR